MIPTVTGECVMCGGTECAQIVTSGWDFEYDTTRQEFSVMQCRKFGHFFLRDLPSQEAMSTVYPSNYYAFSETGSERLFVRTVRERLEARKIGGLLGALAHPARSAIDIGCGDGRLLTLLRRHGAPGLRLQGVEISGIAAERARRAGFPVDTADIDQLKIDNIVGRYDLALMHQVIEHLRSPRRALRVVRELLEPGGIISIETPDIGGWDARLFRRRHWGGYHFPRHFHLFNRLALKTLLEQEGFQIVQTRALPSPVFWIFSVRNRNVDHGVGVERLRWLHYQSVPLLALFTTLDAMQILTAGQSSNQQVWARRL